MVLKKNKIVEERTNSSVVFKSSNELNEVSFHALGTNCTVKFRSDDPKDSNEFVNHLLNWIIGFESRYSRFLEDSLVNIINKNSGISPVETNEDDDKLFSVCNEMHFFTKGVFDPTSLPLLNLWNWKSKNPVVPEDSLIESAKKKVNWNNVEHKSGSFFLPLEGMKLDLGGIGKEYAVDQIVKIAAVQYGLRDLMIDFGQDVFALGAPSGKPAWHIGLDDALNPGNCWAGVAINNSAVASSGDYLRYFKLDGIRYSHIVDVRSGYPVRNDCRSVTVISPSCVMAGILSTTAFILGVENGLKLIESYYRAEGCITTEKFRSKTNKFDEHIVS